VVLNFLSRKFRLITNTIKLGYNEQNEVVWLVLVGLRGHFLVYTNEQNQPELTES